MDALGFDRLSKTLARAATRRGLLRRLAAGPLAAAVAARLGNVTAAQRRPKRRSVQPEIVGGHPVREGEFPFMAFLEIATGGGLATSCGGSLIAPDRILTAAHCTGPDGGFDPPFPPENYFVGIGQVNLDRLAPENAFGVTAVHRHPLWDPNTTNFDVAVLELDRPVPPPIGTPVRFVGAGDTLFESAGQPLEVAGWGLTSTGGTPSTILLAVDVNVVGDAECVEIYGQSGTNIDPASMLCAGAPGRDSCQGDSGGPLFASVQTGTTIDIIKGKKRKGRRRKIKRVEVPVFAQLQVGIVSFGRLCADPVFPGIYAQITNPDIHQFITSV